MKEGNNWIFGGPPAGQALCGVGRQLQHVAWDSQGRRSCDTNIGWCYSEERARTLWSFELVTFTKLEKVGDTDKNNCFKDYVKEHMRNHPAKYKKCYFTMWPISWDRLKH